ncbi:hypothetical protein PCE1_003790 [Barthelona sp. PCE]
MAETSSDFILRSLNVIPGGSRQSVGDELVASSANKFESFDRPSERTAVALCSNETHMFVAYDRVVLRTTVEHFEAVVNDRKDDMEYDTPDTRPCVSEFTKVYEFTESTDFNIKHFFFAKVQEHDMLIMGASTSISDVLVGIILDDADDSTVVHNIINLKKNRLLGMCLFNEMICVFTEKSIYFCSVTGQLSLKKNKLASTCDFFEPSHVGKIIAVDSCTDTVSGSDDLYICSEMDGKLLFSRLVAGELEIFGTDEDSEISDFLGIKVVGTRLYLLYTNSMWYFDCSTNFTWDDGCEIFLDHYYTPQPHTLLFSVLSAQLLNEVHPALDTNNYSLLAITTNAGNITLVVSNNNIVVSDLSVATLEIEELERERAVSGARRFSAVKEDIIPLNDVDVMSPVNEELDIDVDQEVDETVINSVESVENKKNTMDMMCESDIDDFFSEPEEETVPEPEPIIHSTFNSTPNDRKRRHVDEWIDPSDVEDYVSKDAIIDEPIKKEIIKKEIVKNVNEPKHGTAPAPAAIHNTPKDSVSRAFGNLANLNVNKKTTPFGKVKQTPLKQTDTKFGKPNKEVTKIFDVRSEPDENTMEMFKSQSERLQKFEQITETALHQKDVTINMLIERLDASDKRVAELSTALDTHVTHVTQLKSKFDTKVIELEEVKEQLKTLKSFNNDIKETVENRPIVEIRTLDGELSCHTVEPTSLDELGYDDYPQMPSLSYLEEVPQWSFMELFEKKKDEASVDHTKTMMTTSRVVQSKADFNRYKLSRSQYLDDKLKAIRGRQHVPLIVDEVEPELFELQEAMNSLATYSIAASQTRSLKLCQHSKDSYPAYDELSTSGKALLRNRLKLKRLDRQLNLFEGATPIDVDRLRGDMVHLRTVLLSMKERINVFKNKKTDGDELLEKIQDLKPVIPSSKFGKKAKGKKRKFGFNNTQFLRKVDIDSPLKRSVPKESKKETRKEIVDKKDSLVDKFLAARHKYLSECEDRTSTLGIIKVFDAEKAYRRYPKITAKDITDIPELPVKKPKKTLTNLGKPTTTLSDKVVETPVTGEDAKLTLDDISTEKESEPKKMELKKPIKTPLVKKKLELKKPQLKKSLDSDKKLEPKKLGLKKPGLKLGLKKTLEEQPEPAEPTPEPVASEPVKDVEEKAEEPTPEPKVKKGLALKKLGTAKKLGSNTLGNKKFGLKKKESEKIKPSAPKIPTFGSVSKKLKDEEEESESSIDLDSLTIPTPTDTPTITEDAPPRVDHNVDIDDYESKEEEIEEEEEEKEEEKPKKFKFASKKSSFGSSTKGNMEARSRVGFGNKKDTPKKLVKKVTSSSTTKKKSGFMKRSFGGSSTSPTTSSKKPKFGFGKSKASGEEEESGTKKRGFNIGNSGSSLLKKNNFKK